MQRKLRGSRIGAIDERKEGRGADIFFRCLLGYLFIDNSHILAAWLGSSMKARKGPWVSSLQGTSKRNGGGRIGEHLQALAVD